MRSIPFGARILAAALFLHVPAPSQWASLGTAATDPVYQEGFQVLTITGGQAHVFSAMSRNWRALGTWWDGGHVTPALQTGDWVALLRISDHDWRAYSARLDQYADIHFVEAPDQLTVCVEDDVILMLGTRRAGGAREACGYSGQTNRWHCISIAPCSIACSRFVLGLKIDGADDAWGFSARFGNWVRLEQHGGTLAADGNVLLLKGTPTASCAAFSGVLGVWTVSPTQSPTSVPALDHNVAYVRASGGTAAGQNCAYSAYTGVWSTAGPANAVQITDNTVLAETSTALVRAYRAFSARPGAWSLLTIPVAASVTTTTDADWIVVNNATTGTLHAFSGLCGGA